MNKFNNIFKLDLGIDNISEVKTEFAVLTESAIILEDSSEITEGSLFELAKELGILLNNEDLDGFMELMESAKYESLNDDEKRLLLGTRIDDMETVLSVILGIEIDNAETDLF